MTDPLHRHLLLDQVLPRLLSHCGTLILHASAITIEEDVILFMGPSGSGKSTLAAKLASTTARLIADDSVMLHSAAGTLQLVGSYPGLRLWPSAAASVRRSVRAAGQVSSSGRKRRYVVATQAMANCGESAVNAARVCVLLLRRVRNPTALARARSLSPSSAAIELLRNSFQLDDDPAMLSRRLSLVATLFEHPVQVAELVIDDNFACLGRLSDALASSRWDEAVGKSVSLVP
jgi:energy-coupling factor transporter ATP-binding protein EcfA2